MGIRNLKPNTPGSRFASRSDFSEITKSTPLRKMKYLRNINFFSEQDFYSVLIRLNGTNFSIDSNSCSIFSEGLINSKFKIINRVDPCYKLKSIKTNK